MVRFALAFTLLAVATAVSASIGAPIAYSLGRDVYLMNPDGSGKRQIYRGATGTSIFAISMKKGGGEMSFEEVSKNGSSSKLITLSYGTSGTGQVIRSINGCRWDVSTRDDGAILAVNLCAQKVKFAPGGSSALTDLATMGRASKAAWMADGSFIYTSGGTIRHATLDNPAGSEVATQDCVQSLNPAHSGSEALVAVANCIGGPAIYRMMIPSGQSTQLGVGPDAAYSQDDECFIVVTPPQRRSGSYLLIARVDGSGSSTQVGNVGSYGSVDWRGDDNPSTCPLLSNDAFRFREVK